jgi:ketosteroid isomerase-like protein
VLVKTRVLAAALAFALVPAGVVAAPQPPPVAVLNLANAIVHAANTGDASGLAALFTADAVMVDENPPFVWRGTGAGVAWWHVVDAVIQKATLKDFRATNVRVSEFRSSGSDAYMVQVLTILAVANGKPFAESGTMTYTFHNAGGKWLISSAVWTTKP